MAANRPRIWWASPCAGGVLYKDRAEAELFGIPSFCAKCAGYHVRDGPDGRDDPDANDAGCRSWLPTSTRSNAGWNDVDDGGGGEG